MNSITNVVPEYLTAAGDRVQRARTSKHALIRLDEILIHAHIYLFTIQ